MMRSRSFKQQAPPATEANVKVKYLNEAELAQAFLSSPSSVRVIEALYQGSSFREAAEIASVSVDAARKVLAVLQTQK